MKKPDKTKPGDDSLEVSKSQRKREANELLDLAKKIIAMPGPRLKRLPLESSLRSEIDFARNIRSHGAKKRQLMTVAKMLRQIDAEPLLDAVSNIDQKNRQATAHHHQIEAWRDKLITGTDTELTELLSQSPNSNAQTLRQLIRNAKKETQLNKPPAAARKLFKLLRDMDNQTPLPPISAG
jgi:ribosome-associated protein